MCVRRYCCSRGGCVGTHSSARSASPDARGVENSEERVGQRDRYYGVCHRQACCPSQGAERLGEGVRCGTFSARSPIKLWLGTNGVFRVELY
ncbi:hypothetical protein ElyMa_000579500 [Elysia marginata]|uniref:Uncharacterized protein n=1 Tax=Elysia marginata TaxID=1093978 RepID=A0AAV4G5T4_9GAST|nr:hypothetical protein ElyMa_000579500 [Elysia marginata]